MAVRRKYYGKVSLSVHYGKATETGSGFKQHQRVLGVEDGVNVKMTESGAQVKLLLNTLDLRKDSSKSTFGSK